MQKTYLRILEEGDFKVNFGKKIAKPRYVNDNSMKKSNTKIANTATA